MLIQGVRTGIEKPERIRQGVREGGGGGGEVRISLVAKDQKAGKKAESCKGRERARKLSLREGR